MTESGKKTAIVFARLADLSVMEHAWEAIAVNGECKSDSRYFDQYPNVQIITRSIKTNIKL